jgi:hypothetical protein
MKNLIAYFLLALALCMNCYAKEDFPSSEKPKKRVSVSEDPYYKNSDKAFKNLISQERKNKKTNHFCVIGYIFNRDVPVVWVHWREESRLILWEGGQSQSWRDDSLAMGRRDLKLGKDTVESEKDLNGSTYLTTNKWWHAVADDCAAHGEKFTVPPFKATKPYVGTEQ